MSISSGFVHLEQLRHDRPSASPAVQLALDGAQRRFEAVDASAVPSRERCGQLALKPLAALRQFALAHFAFPWMIAPCS